MIYLSSKFRADEFGWTGNTNGVLMTPNDYETITMPMVNNEGNIRNIITNYGTVTLENITKHEHTYVNQTIRRDQSYQALL